MGTIGASQCNVFRRITAITKSTFKDHTIHGGNTLQTIRSPSAKVCHEFYSAMTKQYTKQTVCRPFGHSAQRLSHELCNAMTRQ